MSLLCPGPLTQKYSWKHVGSVFSTMRLKRLMAWLEKGFDANEIASNMTANYQKRHWKRQQTASAITGKNKIPPTPRVESGGGDWRGRFSASQCARAYCNDDKQSLKTWHRNAPQNESEKRFLVIGPGEGLLQNQLCHPCLLRPDRSALTEWRSFISVYKPRVVSVI